MTVRGQANLAALAVAVVLLVAATGVGLALAGTADDTGGSERAWEHRLAAATAARLVAAESPLTARRLVVDTGNVTVDAADLPAALAESNASVRVRLGDETLFARGAVDPRVSGGGVRVGRLVLAGDGETVARRADLTRSNVTVPRGVRTVTVTPDPATNTTVTTLRVDGRIVRYDEDGVNESQTLRVDPARETALRAETATNRTGSLLVRYRRVVGEPTTLEVWVDA